MFNKIIGDSGFELEFAGFLDGCGDIVSFVKNSQSTEFQSNTGTRTASISNYFPDFIVKRSERKSGSSKQKGARTSTIRRSGSGLKDWVGDATARGQGVTYRAMFVREEEWKKQPLKGFSEAQAAFETS